MKKLLIVSVFTAGTFVGAIGCYVLMNGSKTAPPRHYAFQMASPVCGAPGTGRGGPPDEACVTEWVTEDDGSKSVLSMCGIKFDAGRWYGSGFFLLDDSFFTMVTKKVVSLLERIGAKGWEAEAAEDFEM